MIFNMKIEIDSNTYTILVETNKLVFNKLAFCIGETIVNIYY